MGTTSNLLKPLGLVILCLLLAGITLGGTVSMDGSLPGSVSISGATYTISAGRQSGANQFYSFQQLNLIKGDVASFTTPMSVSNIIARVTGGASSIDGTISAPSASFYLINNQGVIFGPDASLNVGGAFVVTTADELKFADGKVFTATPSGSDATLSTAAPSAFGFLSSQPAAVTINGSNLTASPGQPMAIAAGDVTIQGATITSSGGAVAITSVGSSGSAVLTGSVGSAADVSSFSQMGTLQITESSTIDVDGPAGGGIAVRAGSFTLTDSFLSAQTTDVGNGAGVDVLLSGDLNLTNSSIITSTTGSGNAGNISLVADNITISGLDANVTSSDPSFSTGGSIEAVSNGSGAAGNITLTAGGDASLTDGARLESASFVSGTGGNDGNITVSVSGAFTINADNTELFTGILNDTTDTPGGAVNITAGSFSMLNGSSIINDDTFGAGNGGNLTIVVSGAMILQDTQDTTDSGIYLTTDTYGTGNAGNLSITAQSLVVDGETNNTNVGTTSGGSGNAGTVLISTGTLAVQNGGVIFADPFGSGGDGIITLNVSGSVLLDGGTSPNITGISNSPSPSTLSTGGSAGDVTVNAANLTIQNGAQIRTSSFGNVNGGNITVAVSGSATLDGGTDSLGQSGITAEALGSGTGGTITLSAGTLSITNGAEISASTQDVGNGGNVNITVQSVATLDGITPLGASGIFATSDSSAGGPGGAITVSAGTLFIQNGAEISTSTAGSGAGGNISVLVSGIATLNGSTNGATPPEFCGIYATSTLFVIPGGGNGGNISVTAQGLTILNAAEINASTSSTGAAGNVSVSITGPVTFDGSAYPTRFTGLDAETNYQDDGGGNAGDVMLTCTSLTMNDAQIDARTTGTGAGGSLNVAVQGAFTLVGPPVSGGNALFNAELSVRTEDVFVGAGNAGNLTLTCGSLLITNFAEISASTFGSGMGGNVAVTVLGNLTINGGGNGGQSGIFSNSIDAVAFGGSAGSVTVSAASLTISDEGSIGASTHTTSNAGNVNVSVSGAVTLDGIGADPGQTGIAAETTYPLIAPIGGNAGNVTLDCGSLVMNGASIEAESSGTGAAGSVTINVAQSSSVSSASAITVSAPQNNGGDIGLVAGDNILIDHSSVSAFAADIGGNITLDAPNLITVANSSVDGHAGLSGGHITIDPQFVIIGPDSVVDGLSNGQDVLVTIQPTGGFLLSSNSDILTNRQEFSVNNDIVANLAVLQASLADVNAQLAPTCAMFAGSNTSTLIQTSNGGLPPEPGGWNLSPMPNDLLKREAVK